MRKTVLVTGSSSGIGKEIARILAKDYDVILHYNSNENSTNIPIIIYNVLLSMLNPNI